MGALRKSIKASLPEEDKHEEPKVAALAYINGTGTTVIDGIGAAINLFYASIGIDNVGWCKCIFTHRKKNPEKVSIDTLHFTPERLSQCYRDSRCLLDILSFLSRFPHPTVEQVTPQTASELESLIQQNKTYTHQILSQFSTILRRFFPRSNDASVFFPHLKLALVTSTNEVLTRIEEPNIEAHPAFNTLANEVLRRAHAHRVLLEYLNMLTKDQSLFTAVNPPLSHKICLRPEDFSTKKKPTPKSTQPPSKQLHSIKASQLTPEQKKRASLATAFDEARAAIEREESFPDHRDPVQSEDVFPFTHLNLTPPPAPAPTPLSDPTHLW